MPIIQIVVASTREGRIGRSVADWVFEVGRERGGAEIELVDLKDVALPMFDEPNHPRLGQYMNDHTKRWSAKVAGADAFIFVTPEYNHSFPASLKNAIDYLHNEWLYKPVGFVSYGGVAAGTRAVQALKPVLAALQMIPVLEGVSIPFVHTNLGADGRFNAPDGLADATKLMFARTEFWIARQASLYQGR
ncbi:NADPH-dependent oxidoreductase [Aquibium carbonis]|uniref:NADPH-dependent oxidoreductase n=1 Tax=Aquibium carbonis TaxID=2495581 RepID=A0A429YZ48_9HYPH|nr:NAD(P)H-dependent oxidoreductase [Aquibium carbonis]RST86731.1 NADPH-dependent oxidoreductase [Aquibium carbonis]